MGQGALFSPIPKKVPKRVVVIDPGHGGTDSGATGTNGN